MVEPLCNSGVSHIVLSIWRDKRDLARVTETKVRAFNHALLEGCEGCMCRGHRHYHQNVAAIGKVPSPLPVSIPPFIFLYSKLSLHFSSNPTCHVVRQLPTPLSLARRCHCLEHRHFTVLAAWVHLLSLPQWTVPLLQLPRVSSSTV